MVRPDHFKHTHLGTVGSYSSKNTSGKASVFVDRRDGERDPSAAAQAECHVGGGRGTSSARTPARTEDYGTMHQLLEERRRREGSRGYMHDVELRYLAGGSLESGEEPGDLASRWR